ncbi:MAG: flagellar biosynthetic protein FliO, partial [Alphaproteobacteria bacterium]|nr:flagellar biosynthetic protein FliO [Alphaproteobacteria bacterium]
MDFGDYFQFVLALIFVLGLIGGLTLLVRRFGLGGIALRKGAENRRLQVVDVTALDARRRLVLVRRDT